MGSQLKDNLSKLKAESLSEKERKKLLAVFHEPVLEYDVKKELYQQLEQVADICWDGKESKEGFDRLWEKIETSDRSNFDKKIKLNFWYCAVAILIIGLLIVNIIPSGNTKQTPAYYTAIAPEGAVSKVILPDGTFIFLNAASEVKYTSNTDEKIREVYLRGEAWFDVHKSKDVPFIVHTSCYDLKVMGTKFNVRSYESDNRSIATLEEGKISIKPTVFQNEDKEGTNTNEIILKPGDQLTFYKDQNRIEKSRVNAQDFGAWRTNALVFNDASMVEMAKELERKFNVKIELMDNELLTIHYNGKFSNDQSFPEVIDILERTLHIRCDLAGNKLKIYNK